MKYKITVLLILVLSVVGQDYSLEQCIPVLHSQSNMVINSDTIFIGSYDGCIIKSVDNGDTWDTLTVSPGESILSIATDQNNIYIGTSTNLYYSSDNGISWNISPDDIGYINTLFTNINKVFASTSSGEYYSYDNGLTWVRDTMYNSVTCFASNSRSHVFIGTHYTIVDDGLILRSTDNGTNWTNLLTIPSSITSIAINSYDHIFASTSSGKVYSSYNTIVWGTIGRFGSSFIYDIAVNSINHIFICINDGIYKSTNYGDSWELVNDLFARHIAFDSIGRLVAKTDTGIYRSIQSTDDIIENTSIAPNPKLQIYPNPFNSVCTIIVPPSSTINIYDTNGRYISGNKSISSTYKWNPSDIQSSIYIIQVTDSSTTYSTTVTYLK